LWYASLDPLRFSPVAFVFNTKYNWFDLVMDHLFSGQFILQLAILYQNAEIMVTAAF